MKTSAHGTALIETKKEIKGGSEIIVPGRPVLRLYISKCRQSALLPLWEEIFFRRLYENFGSLFDALRLLAAMTRSLSLLISI